MTREEQIEALENEISELVTKQMLAQSKMEKADFVEVIKQMVLSGDFVKYTHQLTGAFKIQYIPFYEKSLLQNKIQNLEQVIKIYEAALEDAIIGYNRLFEDKWFMNDLADTSMKYQDCSPKEILDSRRNQLIEALAEAQELMK